MFTEPIAPELRRKRLLVVTTGVLQYVPFAMLPDPSSTRGAQPLIVDHELAYLPSASMFKLLRDEHGAGTMTRRSVAVLADPVFDRSDPRIDVGSSTSPNSPHPSSVSTVSSVVERLGDVG
jgi:CHAT domain